MSNSIRLPPEQGANRVIPRCSICGDPKNEIILAGQLSDDQEATQSAVCDVRPCDTCRGYMAEGVILISVRNGESGDNPYRTGGWVVVTDDAIRRLISTPELRDDILKKRVAFLPDEVWDAIRLPRGSAS